MVLCVRVLYACVCGVCVRANECEFLLCVRVCFLSVFYVSKRAPVCIVSRKWKNKGDTVSTAVDFIYVMCSLMFIFYALLLLLF